LLKNEILKINQDIMSVFSDVKTIPGISENSFDDWEKTCKSINRQMVEDIIRVGIVGTIKSGKSTFVNSIFKGDYLRRGAGVVTSIVTKVHSGRQLKAKLFFKSWDEVNSDMEQAMTLFPSPEWRSGNEQFDIRGKKDRTDLKKALDSLGTEQLITNGSFNVNSLLLSSYLKGYERVKDIISSETVTKEYENDSFAEHGIFVGEEALAVYLRDILLEIDSNGLDRNIEIADCQGSDSPNPLHLAMIQEYMFSAHLLIYVISSRTGLRQADIKFLSIINKMGIIDNVIFVVNCDFSEHDSLDGLNSLVEKVKEELSLIKAEPEIYTFSALFNLFKTQRTQLNPKDRARLDQWEKDKDIPVFSDQETRRFQSSFHHKLTKERYSLLLKNHLERLKIIAAGLVHWTRINQDLLTRDTLSANQIIENIKYHQEKMNPVKTMIRTTLDGVVQKIQKELKMDTDNFFDRRYGDVTADVIEFIRNYRVSYDQYKENLTATGFSNTLYLVFQEFKQALDTFMAESINPKVIGFVKKEEKKVKDYFESIAGPYDMMVKDALAEYKNTMNELGIPTMHLKQQGIKPPDPESLKQLTGLKIPPLIAMMHYTTKVKTEAIMRLGFYAVVNVFKKLFKKPVQNKNSKEFLALKDAVSQIKNEIEKSVTLLFKDYKENLKFQYFFKLVEMVSNNFYQVLLDHFQAYVTDLSEISNFINEKRIDKERVSGTLKNMEVTCKEINERIESVRKKIESANQD